MYVNKINTFLINFVTYFIFITVGVLFSFEQNLKDWENPQVNQINTEEPHATFIPYSTSEKALNNDLKENEIE